jgi:hypothetical protein
VTSSDAELAVRPPYWTAITAEVASGLPARNGAVAAANAPARSPEIPCAASRPATCAWSAPPGPHADVASTSRTAFSLATGSGSFGAIGNTRLAGSGGGAEVVEVVGTGVADEVDDG